MMLKIITFFKNKYQFANLFFFAKKHMKAQGTSVKVCFQVTHKTPIIPIGCIPVALS